ncbi:hypothetical protein D3C73_695720 [compost metagenome]
MSGFDLGDVQDVADQLQQDHRRILDAFQVLALLGVQFGHAHELQRAQYAIQRRADLVAHGGQEGGLRFAGLVGVAFGLRQGAFDLGPCADVRERAQHHVLLLVARGRIGHVQGAAVVGMEGFNGAGRRGGQHLVQQRPGGGRIAQALAGGGAQPFQRQTVGEQHVAVRARQHAQRDGRGLDQGAVEFFAFGDVAMRVLRRFDHAPGIPALVADAAGKAQQQQQRGADR